ncbi:MAG: hypothetical protein RMJ56_09525 [Gemmataceae bacterium]|nr:hypothetical protein [Gemmata sp.]MDW8197829.1 hypothetical protein [Gemmataceae bacterium]
MTRSAANSPTNAASTLRRRYAPLVAAVAVMTAGVLTIWQAFHWAGFGADFHMVRALAASLPLALAGLVIASWQLHRASRIVVVLCGLTVAALAWWFVPSSTAAGALSLHQAVRAESLYREHLRRPTVDEFDRTNGLLEIRELHRQFPSLTGDLLTAHRQWLAGVAEELKTHYERTPPDDVATLLRWDTLALWLSGIYPDAQNELTAASRAWLKRATEKIVNEWRQMPPGDWSAFERTALERRSLVQAFPDIRGELLPAEADWIDRSIQHELERAAQARRTGEAPRRYFWRELEREVLELPTLDTTEHRFLTSRRRLFEQAHATAQAEAIALLQAGNYTKAHNLARKHAVDWNATAALLGPGELKKLDQLRSLCFFFDLMFATIEPPAPAEIAPPPRERQEGGPDGHDALMP